MQQIYTNLYPSKLKWLPMTFGMFKRRSLPETVFERPSYIPWLIENNVIDETGGKYAKALAWQAKFIGALTSRIKPSDAPREQYEFLVLKDQKDVLARVLTVKKGSAMPKKFEGKFMLDKRMAVLDVKIYREYEEPRVSSERLAASLRKILFPNRIAPCAAEYQDYMLTFSNFAVAFERGAR